MKPRAGYTLAELLVVLVIIALVSAIVLPRFFVNHPGRELQRASGQLATLLREGRQTAMQSGDSREVILQLDNKTASMRGRNKLVLPKDIEIDSRTAAPVSSDDTAGVMFFPDGSSTGGEFILELAGKQRTVSVNWANGAVHVRTTQQD